MMNLGKNKLVVCIAGPTASGKSVFGVRIAKATAKYGGAEIINADAMQVYAGIPVLSAQPTIAERDGVPHHLFGHVEPTQRHSAARWASAASAKIRDVWARGKLPILIGGTGLYFRALMEGLSRIPQIDPPALETAQVLLDEEGLDGLSRIARIEDPVAAAKVSDPQRLLRLVSVAWQTDRPLSAWQSELHPSLPEAVFAPCIVDMERSALYARIDARFDAMMSGKALDEAKAMAALPTDLPAARAIGVKTLSAAARGEMELPRAIELAKRDSRRLAKRQSTWFRNQTKAWPRVTDEAQKANYIKSLEKRLAG